MLRLVILFLILAVVTGFIGFFGFVAGIIGFVAVGMAKLMFKLFLCLFVIALLVHLFRGGR